MCVVNLDECYCDCHGVLDVSHVMPCCDGKCPLCGVYITHMEAHNRRHYKEFSEAFHREFPETDEEAAAIDEEDD